MAEKSLGSISAKITADATELDKNLAQAQTKLGGWVETMNAKGSMAAAATGGVVAMLAVKGLELLGKSWSKIKDIQGEIAGEEKIAKRFNITHDSLQRMMFGTRQSAEETSAMLETMGSAISTASMQGGRSARPLNQLGFEQADIRGLATGGSDAAFETIAARLREIGPGLHQARLASQLFGSSATSALDAINGNYEQNIAQAREYGLIVGGEGSEAAREASKAYKEMGAIQMGMWRTAAVAMRPVIGLFNTWILEGWRVISPAAIAVINFLGGIASAVGSIVSVGKDILGEMFGGFDLAGYFRSGIDSVSNWKNSVIDAAEWVANAVVGMGQWFIRLGLDIYEGFAIPGIRALTGFMRAMSEVADSVNTGFVQPIITAINRILQGMEGLASNDPTGVIAAQIRGARIMLNAGGNVANNVGANLRGNAGNLDNTANVLGIGVTALRANLNGRAEMVDNFFNRVRARANQGAAPQVENNQWMIDLSNRAQQFHDRMNSPLETLTRSLREVNDLMQWQDFFAEENMPDLGLDDAMAGRAMLDALRTAEGALNIQPVKFAGLMTDGSKEAANLIYHAGRDNSNDPAERLRRIQARALQVQEQQAEQGRQLLEAVRRQPELLRL